MSGKLFIISACSGAGKTTLVQEVLPRVSQHHPLKRVVTYTSRAVRPGEIAGDHYHFVTAEVFQEKIQGDFFLEWSGEYDHFYGTPRYIIDEVLGGESRILVIDRLGAHNVLKMANKEKGIFNRELVVPIWIEVPGLAELRRRLLARGENEERVERRLEIARKEMELEKQNSFYKYKIVNDIFTRAAHMLEILLVQELAKH
jgi:guanylate kinase